MKKIIGKKNFEEGKGFLEREESREREDKFIEKRGLREKNVRSLKWSLKKKKRGGDLT